MPSDTPRAWTPGPWVSNYAGIFMGGGGEFSLGMPNVMNGRYRRKHDVELASLSPQMAEALYLLDDACYDHDCRGEGDPECWECKAVAALHKVTEKLRAIGRETI